MHTTSPMRVRLRAAGSLWLWNVALIGLLSATYLEHAPAPRSFRMAVFLYLGLLSSAATLTVLPGLLALALAALVRRAWPRAVSQGVLWTLLALAVFVDTRIYGIFRYHFNGMVWNVMTTPGSDEAVHIAWQEEAVVATVVVLLLALQVGGLRFLERRVAAPAELGRLLRAATRPVRVWLLAIVPAMLVVMGLYAHADLVRDRQVMGLAGLYPVYPRVTIKRLADKVFHYDLAERPKVHVATENVLLAYPREEPVIPPDGPRPSIVVLVADSLRSDMLTPENMPHVSAFAQGARVFRNHLSSGNGTRFGVFGLVYGLYGSYWKPIYQEQRSPVLIDTLIDRGYDFNVLTSASMSYPEFRTTAWVRIEDDVHDVLNAEHAPSDAPVRPGGRDDLVVSTFLSWLDARPADAPPFFAFILLDAPHQPYGFPEEFAHFQPYTKTVSYVELGGDPDAAAREAFFHRYENAVLYADDSIGRVLDGLRAHGILDDTVVAITGDHGEEFWENGLLGHTSSFAPVQAHVPFVLAGPGVTPGEETRPTSHIDLAPTLLGMLGADLSHDQDWTMGKSLLDPPAKRDRVVAGWNDLGVYVDGGIVHVPLEAYAGFVEVMDDHWKPVPDDHAVLAANPGVLARLALDCRRFLR